MAGSPVQLAVLISGGGRTLANIHERICAGTLDARVRVVISSRGDVRGASGQTRRYPVTLNADETTVELNCPFEHTEVVLDPDDKLLKEMVVKSDGSGQ